MHANQHRERNSPYVVIRHLRDRDEYLVEYGEGATDLVAGPRFASLDRAIDWVEGLDQAAPRALGGQVGND